MVVKPFNPNNVEYKLSSPIEDHWTPGRRLYVSPLIVLFIGLVDADSCRLVYACFVRIYIRENLRPCDNPYNIYISDKSWPRLRSCNCDSRRRRELSLYLVN
jgi:hypothetical protein